MPALLLTLRLIAERMVRLPMHAKIRPVLLRMLGADIGRGVRIDELQLVNLTAGFGNLHVGDEAYIGAGSMLDLTASIHIGAHASIAPGCTILTHADPGSMYGNRLVEEYPRRVESVTIGDHAWLGARATVLCGVAIGEAAVVGAGSLVTKDVVDGSVIHGVPAKEQRTVRHQ